LIFNIAENNAFDYLKKLEALDKKNNIS